MTTRPYSLRRRLIATTLGSAVLVGLIGTAIVVTVAWQEAGEAFDDALREGARLTLSVGAGLAALGGLEDGRSVDRSRDRSSLQYQLIDDDGEVIRRSSDAPRRPFVATDRRDRRALDDRFVDVRQDGERWRVYVARHRDPEFSVQVAQPMAERIELIEAAVEKLVWPLAVLWLLLGVGNWWAIRRLLRPLERLTASLEARRPDEARAVPADGQAREVVPLVGALNDLLARLSRRIEGERRFTADAAHELRTPLAAIASRIQLMQRRQPAGDPMAADLRSLRGDVARATALVGNLLALARLDPDAVAAAARQPVDLPALLAQVRSDCAPLAADRAVTVTVQCRLGRVSAHPEALATAVRNLLDNAIRHGGPAGRVLVGAGQEGRDLVITVADDGPGVDPVEYARLADRFYRLLGSGESGSGLGLSIVARVAQLHGGRLVLGAGLDGRGFGATLRWPIADVA